MPKDDDKIKKRLSMIGHKVLVLSGKGGVGKSTVAVNLAVALAAAGKKVGLLDVDIHGPSVPKLLGVEGFPLHGTEESLHPLEIGDNLRVMSIGFLLKENDDAVIWRGPMKFGVIKQFLGDVEWGELDYLVVDSPPGTGDEPLTIAQLISDADGAVIVTTPQDVALIDVRKCINFCRQLSLPVIGVVENMSGFYCPHCGEKTEIFKGGGGKKMAEDMGVPFLGSLPIDPSIVSSSDEGKPYVIDAPGTETGKMFAALAAPILRLGEKHSNEQSAGAEAAGDESTVAEPVKTKAVDAEPLGAKRAAASMSTVYIAQKNEAGRKEAMNESGSKRRIAVPVAEGRLSMHFGHSEKFALVDVASGKIVASEFVEAPPHQPGLLPAWLGERGANLIIAGGMGSRAKNLFEENGIEVVVGAPCESPERIVERFLAGELELGDNTCDH
jgi:ATP-binding protein involved in chromosome partitioning